MNEKLKKLKAEAERKSAESARFHVVDDQPPEADEIEEVPFPLHCFPPFVRDMVEEVNRTANVASVSLTAGCALGIASAALGAGVAIASGGGRSCMGNLWVMPLAHSGLGKSSVLNPLLQPLLEAEADAQNKFDSNEGPQLEVDQGYLTEKIKTMRKDYAKARDESHPLGTKIEGIRRGLTQMIDQLNQVEDKLKGRPCFRVEDSTPEALLGIVSGQCHNAVASISAEARAIIKVITGRYDSGGAEAIYCGLFSGDPIAVDRITRGPERVKGYLSALWLGQPDVGTKVMEDEEMLNSGLVARMLLYQTNAIPQHSSKESIAPMVPKVQDAWSAKLKEICSAFRENPEDVKVIPVELKVNDLLIDFQNRSVDARIGNGFMRKKHSIAARWAESAWKIILILHCLDHGAAATQIAVPFETAERGVELMDWFIDQQEAAILGNQLVDDNKELKEVIAVFEASGRSEMTRREISRSSLKWKADDIDRFLLLHPTRFTSELKILAGSQRKTQIIRILPE